MRVAFWLNAFTIRGVERAVLDYATALERNPDIIPHGESWILYHTGVAFHLDSRGVLDHSEAVYSLFAQRFKGRMLAYSSVPHLLQMLERHGIRTIHMLRSGEREPALEPLLHIPNLRVLVHCVFTCSQPHGSVYAAISEPVSRTCLDPKFRIPVVPHMVVPLSNSGMGWSLRESLGIRPDQVVIGRYGGWETFDIPWVQECVMEWATGPQDNHLVFVFMNTKPFGEIHVLNNNNNNGPITRPVMLPGSSDPAVKASYIDSCDVMLHARKDGESFGLAVAEFAQRGVRVMTYNGPDLLPVYFRHHESILGADGLYYQDKASLNALFKKLNDPRQLEELRTPVVPESLARFTELEVMKQFKEVFLSPEK
jgi:hypothetical protein